MPAKMQKIDWSKKKKVCVNCAHFFREKENLVGKCTVLGVKCADGECIVDSIKNLKLAEYAYSYPVVNNNFGCIYWEESEE